MRLLEHIIVLVFGRNFGHVLVLGELFRCVLVVVIMLGSVVVMLMFS